MVFVFVGLFLFDLLFLLVVIMVGLVGMVVVKVWF